MSCNKLHPAVNKGNTGSGDVLPSHTIKTSHFRFFFYLSHFLELFNVCLILEALTCRNQGRFHLTRMTRSIYPILNRQNLYAQMLTQTRITSKKMSPRRLADDNWLSKVLTSPMIDNGSTVRNNVRDLLVGKQAKGAFVNDNSRQRQRLVGV